MANRATVEYRPTLHCMPCMPKTPKSPPQNHPSCYVILTHPLPHCAFQGGFVKISRVASGPAEGSGPLNPSVSYALVTVKSIRENKRVRAFPSATSTPPPQPQSSRGRGFTRGPKSVTSLTDRQTNKCTSLLWEAPLWQFLITTSQCKQLSLFFISEIKEIVRKNTRKISHKQLTSQQSNCLCL